MIRKVIIAIPFMTLVGLGVIITLINMDDADDLIVQEDPIEAAAPEKLEMSEHNPFNPKYKGNQTTESSFDGTVEGFLTDVYMAWTEFEGEEKYDHSVSSTSYGLVASVVSEVNYLEPQIADEWMWKFEELRETAHQLTSPLMELDYKERVVLIHEFEEGLSKLYQKIVLQS